MTGLVALVLEQPAPEDFEVPGYTAQEYFVDLLAATSRGRCDEPLDIGRDPRLSRPDRGLWLLSW